MICDKTLLNPKFPITHKLVCGAWNRKHDECWYYATFGIWMLYGWWLLCCVVCEFELYTHIYVNLIYHVFWYEHWTLSVVCIMYRVIYPVKQVKIHQWTTLQSSMRNIATRTWVSIEPNIMKRTTIHFWGFPTFYQIHFVQNVSLKLRDNISLVAIVEIEFRCGAFCVFTWNLLYSIRF